MSFGGHVFDMINRMKQNRAQRPSNRAKFKENNRTLIYSKDSKSDPLQFKTVSDKELKEIKTQTEFKIHSQTKRIKERVFYGIAITCVLVTIIWILMWMN